MLRGTGRFFGVWVVVRLLYVLADRTECAVCQKGQGTAFAQFSGLRKDTITASEAV